MENKQTIELFSKKALEANNKDTIEKFARCTITIPISLTIKIDVERQKNNLTRSACIREILESYFSTIKEETINIETLNNKLDEIKELIVRDKNI